MDGELTKRRRGLDAMGAVGMEITIARVLDKSRQSNHRE